MAEYNIVITIGGQKVAEAGPITLSNEEKWEQEVSFTPIETGENQKVEFQLHKGGSPDVYQSLRLWIDVAGAE